MSEYIPGAVFQRANGMRLRLRAPVAGRPNTWTIDLWTCGAWGFFGGQVHESDLLPLRVLENA